MLKLLGLPTGFLGVLIICLIVLYYIDPPLTKDAKLYIPDTEKVTFEDNGLIYLNGFNVPSTINPYEYGLFSFKQRHNVLEQNTNYEVFENLGLKEHALEYIGEDNLACWYQHAYEPDSDDEICPTSPELQKIIKDNSVLLNRLTELAKFTKFETDMRITDNTMLKGQSFISLQRLVNAKAVLLAQEGQAETAYNLWQSNLILQRNLLRSADSLVWSAVVTIGLGISEQTILKLQPYISSNKELMEQAIALLLTPTFSEERPYHQIFGRDFKYAFSGLETLYEDKNFSDRASAQLFYKERSSRNRFAGFVKMIAETEALDQHTYFNQYEFDQDKARNIIKGPWYSLPFYNFIGELLLGGVIKGNELIYNWRYAEIKNRLIALSLYTKIQDIQTKEMNSFLQNAPSVYLNPITNEPFDWTGSSFKLKSPKYPDNIFEISYPLNAQSNP